MSRERGAAVCGGASMFALQRTIPVYPLERPPPCICALSQAAKAAAQCLEQAVRWMRRQRGDLSVPQRGGDRTGGVECFVMRHVGRSTAQHTLLRVPIAAPQHHQPEGVDHHATIVREESLRQAEVDIRHR